MGHILGLDIWKLDFIMCNLTVPLIRKNIQMPVFQGVLKNLRCEHFEQYPVYEHFKGLAAYKCNCIYTLNGSESVLY